MNMKSLIGLLALGVILLAVGLVIMFVGLPLISFFILPTHHSLAERQAFSPLFRYTNWTG